MDRTTLRLIGVGAGVGMLGGTVAFLFLSLLAVFAGVYSNATEMVQSAFVMGIFTGAIFGPVIAHRRLSWIEAALLEGLSLSALFILFIAGIVVLFGMDRMGLTLNRLAGVLGSGALFVALAGSVAGASTGWFLEQITPKGSRS